MKRLPSPRRWRAWASHVAWRLRPAGLTGLALALLALAGVGAGAWVVQPRLDAQQASLASLRMALAQRPTQPPRTGPLDALPALEQVPGFAHALHAEAERAGVAFERAEYRTPETGDARLARLQVVLPAHGDYAAIKRWLARLLAAYPSCAIDELSLQRPEQGGALQARVVLSLYTRAAR